MVLLLFQKLSVEFIFSYLSSFLQHFTGDLQLDSNKTEKSFQRKLDTFRFEVTVKQLKILYLAVFKSFSLLSFFFFFLILIQTLPMVYSILYYMYYDSVYSSFLLF